jgi:GTP-binding protein
MNEEKGPRPAKPLVALVGRPNVGKSAMFNRMVGERRAIVEDIPGTTRDRLVGEVEWRGRTFDLVDTGGVAEPTSVAGSGAYMDHIRRQVLQAIEEADLLLFLVDARSGMTAADQEVADLLRRSGKHTILVANKADNLRRIEEATDFYSLGLGDPQAVSALNGAGIGDLLDLVTELLPELPEYEEGGEAAGLKIAVIGRPNVGKSALVNAILGEERVIVSEIAGTTRDAIDTPFEFEGQPMTLIDTAGMRRPGKLTGSIEHYSVVRAKQAVERADVAVVVYDAFDGLKAQDLHVLELALDEATGVVLAANKWDLMTEEDREKYVARIRRRVRFAPWVPVVPTSGLAGIGIDELLREVRSAGEERSKRIPTSELNAIVRGAIARRPPPIVSRGRLKLLYVTQARVDPPTFIFFVNDASLVPNAYQRYLENALRGAFGFRGTGLRFVFRSRERE